MAGDGGGRGQTPMRCVLRELEPDRGRRLVCDLASGGRAVIIGRCVTSDLGSNGVSSIQMINSPVRSMRWVQLRRMVRDTSSRLSELGGFLGSIRAELTPVLALLSP